MKSNLEVRDLAVRKVQYITMEVLADLGITKVTAVGTAQTLAIAIVVIFLRMCVHYLGQYAALKLMNAPVISLELRWYKVMIDYAYWHIWQQAFVIAIGCLSNTLVFLFLILVCHLSQKHIYCFPKALCKFIAWFGLATVFDFLLVAVVDFAQQDWEGDLFKLYNYYLKASNSGFVGHFLTFLIYFLLLIINCFVFYNYIVFVHNDGRLCDIYVRISGLVKKHFIPEDNEVSFNYLRYIYQVSEINNHRIIVSKIPIR